jgi:hypothetical protein
LQSGIRQVNNPPLLPNEKEAHDWSFLRLQTDLTLAAGQTTINLPDDFGGVEGSILVSTDQQSFCPIRSRGSPYVYELLGQRPNDTGYPREIGVEWYKGTSLEKGQRARLVIYPQADVEYTLKVHYYALLDFITGSKPFPYGGALHAELYLESCLSVAELRRDDMRGIHWEQFMNRLAASVSSDRRNKPQNFGYNGDGTEWQYRDRRLDNPPVVTYNGVTY